MRLRFLFPTLAATLSVLTPGWSQPPVDIAAVLESDSKVHHLALDRFRELAQAAGRASANVTPYVLDADPAKIPEQIARVQARKPRLIFAVGTSAAQIASQRIRDVPIVYSMVLNPARQDLSNSNACGISLDVSPREQLALFAKIKPAARRVGVIYNPAASDNVVEEAAAFARTAGLVLVAKKAETMRDGLVALKELDNEPLDGFLMILDPVIANDASFKLLLAFSLKRRIALIVPADPLVKAGALLSVGADYARIGDQAWDIARRILQGEVKPSDIGIRRPDATISAVNNTIARTLGLEIPRTVKIDIAY
jgi:putative tryptophan/tyrosine transport system substrate-binding protein